MYPVHVHKLAGVRQDVEVRVTVGVRGTWQYWVNHDWIGEIGDMESTAHLAFGFFRIVLNLDDMIFRESCLSMCHNKESYANSRHNCKRRTYDRVIPSNIST